MKFYYYYEKKGGPFTAFLAFLGAILFVLGFFFLALPIFFAAIAVFSGVALYLGWRMKRAIKKMEEELEKDFKLMEDMSESEIIDITKKPLE
ncbi:hypothetical protein DBT_0792 [Dissulfuribacter thermophilus]|uniref:Uncharacterized protein n=1 Tax=Dissulfuribacter thermophilus TaxID=1156395 RepID=A0A1B9F7F4_9BACT|nr:hypothetical protein [Dissulfuribacter thermophilus]OCC15867.1 hypothetical protein DBT_0792 [Dissulfuribacter thermophilus]